MMAQGWKGVVCGFWTSPLLFAVHLATLVVAILLLVLWYRRSRSSRRFKPRSL